MSLFLNYNGYDPSVYFRLYSGSIFCIHTYFLLGSNTIIKGNIDENVLIMAILPKIVTFVKISGENSKRVTNDNIHIANALWEIIYRIVINP